MLDIDDIQHRFDTFRSLMANRIREILLVSSVYDAYILEEDGTLEERLWQQYADRGLSTVPRIRKVSSVERALEVICGEKIDLVVAIVHEERELAVELALKVKAVRPELPVTILATDPSSLPRLSDTTMHHGVDRIFLWQNDPTLLVAIIKYFEDRANVDHDTRVGGVRVVLLVEDSIAHYSTILPAIYTAIMRLTRRVIDEGLNLLHKQLRMRSRAKIVLADSLEEAVDLYRRYRPYILGVVTDVRFSKAGRPEDGAGFELVRMLRREDRELPICIQSAEPEENRPRALALGTYFIDKHSKRLIDDLQRFLRDYMGFGDFIFRSPAGLEISRAGTPRELLDRLREVPIESILHHGRQQHFSHWMMARTEIRIAEQLYPKQADDFSDPEELRNFLVQVIEAVLHEKQSDVITRFIPGRNPKEVQFMRQGEGSLGGKARGIGFLRYLLSRLEIRRLFPDITIQIPPTLVVCSNEFGRFLDDNGLWDDALGGAMPFSELQRRFLKGELRDEMIHDLRAYLQTVCEPLAVRSSSILEDSLHLPLAGLYSTYMLPNNDPSVEERLASLLAAVKLVWASTYGEDARAYFRQTSYRLEDERMAVVIQTLGGGRRGDYFYPSLSGVAQSYNFYPVSYMKPEDGVAQIAVGLGKTVVEGGPIVRFCPRYPQLLPQFANMRDWLYFTQKDFYGLDMAPIQGPRDPATMDRLKLLPLSEAEARRVLQPLASVYQPESGLLVDSFFYEGPRIATFQKVLRDPKLKLGELLSNLLTVSEKAMRTPVEIEFACDLPEEGRPVFYPLQLRPMAAKKRWERIEITPELRQRAFCYSELAHGNGFYRGIHDLVCVKPDTFDISKSRQIAPEIGELNKLLTDEERPYVLVGFGRWGSMDPWMGIGVNWAQISGVRVLVEAGLKGFNAEPAQGTHFFQNVTALNIGCLSVPYQSKSFLEWGKLDRIAPVRETPHLKLLRWATPLEIRIDGRIGEAVICLP
ncbi:MAG TPA: PEP/pyruvate-binding domain-containing protein [Desulfobacterales bacterium]|nr:PEP/pyruvate-binding domain-containing protein [Desulfobacterales bacterium]